MSPKLKCHRNWNIIKTKITSKLKCQQNLNVTQTEISPKLQCHQNWNITKKNDTKTEISQNLKMS